MHSNAFFLGKGGVGKTTTSAAFALRLARSGKKVLIASLDPAHNLGDVLGLALADTPKEVEPGLWAMEVDLASWVSRYLEDSRAELARTYAYNSTLNLDSFFNIMRYSPGTEEYAVLWAIEHVHCNLAGDFDAVVYDTPPTALALRFLAMPSVSELWLAEMAKLRQRILDKRQTIARLNPESPSAASCLDKDDDKVYGKIGSVRRRLAALSRLFKDESYISVVINPDELSVSEALRIQDELDVIGMKLSSLCLNKRGVSTATWTVHPRFAAKPLFSSDFIPHGLSGREAVERQSPSGLVEDFLRSYPASGHSKGHS